MRYLPRLGSLILLLAPVLLVGCGDDRPSSPPPNPRVEVVQAPRPGYYWEGGHWEWHRGEYVWIPGHYIERPEHAVWINGHYLHRRDGSYVWIPGHWREE